MDTKLEIHSPAHDGQRAEQLPLVTLFEHWISVGQASLMLGISRKTLMKKVRLGDLPAYQFGRSWLFSKRELTTLLL